MVFYIMSVLLHRKYSCVDYFCTQCESCGPYDRGSSPWSCTVGSFFRGDQVHSVTKLRIMCLLTMDKDKEDIYLCVHKIVDRRRRVAYKHPKYI